MRAYVLLKVQPQDTTRLLHDLQQNEHVLEASLIHGLYDCLLTVQAVDLDALNAAVLDIRSIPGVLESVSSLIVHSWQRGAA
jgi:hypothetical protein